MYAPWSSKKTLSTSGKLERLSKEILDFVDYIRPTKKEQLERDTLLYEINQIIEHMYPGASLIPFGSYATGLQFPSSDIDTVLKFNIPKPRRQVISILFGLRKALLDRPEMFRHRDISVVASAKIPVLTAKDENGVSIDITVQSDCVSSDRTVAWLKEYKELKPLFLVLKQALSGLRLRSDPNLDPISAKSCGLASYALICMIVSYLQLYGKQMDSSAPDYYGRLLLGFLSFYANFAADTTIIHFNDGGGYYTEDNAPTSYTFKSGKLNIIDPDFPDTNVARSSSKFKSIQEIFQNMYDCLRNSKEGDSVLASIIHIQPYRGKLRGEGRYFMIDMIYVGSEGLRKKRSRKAASILHEAGKPYHKKQKKRYNNDEEEDHQANYRSNRYHRYNYER